MVHNVGDTIAIDDSRTQSRYTQAEFYTNWKPLMDNNANEWVVLESVSDDIAKATNRLTTRATRLNGYDYTNGYEFRCIRRSPNAYFLGRKI